MANLYRQPIVTNIGRTIRLSDFLTRKNNIWLGFGQTSPWSDESNPPAPDLDATSVNQVIGYKKARKVFAVKQDPSGTIEYEGNMWKEIQDSQIWNEKAKFVYIEVLLDPQDLNGEGQYRQIGLFEGLTTSVSATYINPSQVQNTGRMTVLLNRKKVIRNNDQKEQLSLILEF